MNFRVGPIGGVVAKALEQSQDARGWLIELYREDELEAEIRPVMAYVSCTFPGVARGPHEHRHQSDYFAFFGPGDFKLYMWDTRRDSATLGNRQTLLVGESNKQSVIVPRGVVHAYRNVSQLPGIVINCANRLYAGWGKTEAVDEIRHEDSPDSPFVME
jgi:dTDP-4-dehydrorhamnose 3,5-epimerase